MTLKEEDNFKKEVINSIIANPDEALTDFRKKWNTLVFDSKRNIAPFIMKFCMERANSENYHPQRPENYEITRLCANAIYNIIYDEFQGLPSYGHLELGENIKPVDIAAVFKILKEIKYINNTSIEIADVIIKVFNIEANTTILSYLEENSKMGLAAQDFITKIKDSKLVINSTPLF